MEEMSDDVLLEELTKRLTDTRKALSDVMVMNEKIEKLNIKLADSERLKTNFLSNIRNEINNPLTSILGIAREMAAHVRDAERTRQMARMIFGEAFTLDFQLRNIFTAAEIEAGEATVAPARIDPESLVRSVAGAFAHCAEDKNVTMEVAFTAEQAGAKQPFATDPEKLHLVMANLVANAIEYNEAGKSVRIDAATGGGTFRFSITDEGKGIPDGERERLFERFRQLDQGSSKRHKGHGLGLSITKALVDMLGGRITVSRPGQGGTRFDVVVPEASGAASDVFSEDGNEFLFESGTSY
jgi:signal transduction histidine kinase